MKIKNYLAVILVGLTLTTAVKASNTNNPQPKNNTKPRIIALAPHIVEMLFDIGAGEQIIATIDYADYPAAANAIPRIGNSLRIQLERVIELQPDLIVAWKSGNPSDDLMRLKQLGFNVVYSQPNSFADVAKELRLLGEISGHTAQAEQVASKFLADLSKIKSQYQNKKKLLGFYEVWSRPLTTIAKGSWPQQFLDVCGISNPFYQADAGYPQVNIEQILQHNIDIIIQPLSENQVDKKGYPWEQWSIIPAVKHKQIITLDADVIHRMTTRSLNALAKLCEKAEKTRLYYQ